MVYFGGYYSAFTIWQVSQGVVVAAVFKDEILAIAFTRGSTAKAFTRGTTARQISGEA